MTGVIIFCSVWFVAIAIIALWFYAAYRNDRRNQ